MHQRQYMRHADGCQHVSYILSHTRKKYSHHHIGCPLRHCVSRLCFRPRPLASGHMGFDRPTDNRKGKCKHPIYMKYRVALRSSESLGNILCLVSC